MATTIITDDYAIFLATFGHGVGDAEYVLEADLDGDGTVTLVDYQLRLACYRKCVGDALPPPPSLGPPGDSDRDSDVHPDDYVAFTGVTGRHVWITGRRARL